MTHSNKTQCQFNAPSVTDRRRFFERLSNCFSTLSKNVSRQELKTIVKHVAFESKILPTREVMHEVTEPFYVPRLGDNMLSCLWQCEGSKLRDGQKSWRANFCPFKTSMKVRDIVRHFRDQRVDDPTYNTYNAIVDKVNYRDLVPNIFSTERRIAKLSRATILFRTIPGICVDTIRYEAVKKMLGPILEKVPGSIIVGDAVICALIEAPSWRPKTIDVFCRSCVEEFEEFKRGLGEDNYEIDGDWIVTHINSVKCRILHGISIPNHSETSLDFASFYLDCNWGFSLVIGMYSLLSIAAKRVVFENIENGSLHQHDLDLDQMLTWSQRGFKVDVTIERLEDFVKSYHEEWNNTLDEHAAELRRLAERMVPLKKRVEEETVLHFVKHNF